MVTELKNQSSRQYLLTVAVRHALPSNKRHRWIHTSSDKKYDVTKYFVLAWLGSIISAGTLCSGDSNRTINAIYADDRYGVAAPYIRNTMTQKAFLFMPNFIHFSVMADQKQKGERRYDPLFKVSAIIKLLMKGMRGAWVAGDKVTIDKSMIRYMGRAIVFIQYMPRKPIKHGIKVFAICCSYTGVLLGFEVYCGADGIADQDNSAVAVVERLLTDSHLTQARGRIVYTDNWYTTMDVPYKLYNKYGFLFCGTMVPTEKVSCQDMDVPFHKLSQGAKDSVERGWFREAAVQLKTESGGTFYVQCTTWKDRKQVMFLHTTDIGASSGHFVKRSVCGAQGRSTLKAPLAQQNYADHFNAVVDRNDRDSSDYTRLIRTNHWYLRPIFWLLDRIDHIIYVVVVYCAKHEIGSEEWVTYLKKGGCEKFQIDMGVDIMAYAMEHTWLDLDGPRPNWMRQ
jgi:hypothetical protein